MTLEEKIEMTKTFLGTDSIPDDGVIMTYLDIAEQRLLNAKYPFEDTEETDSDGNRVRGLPKKHDRDQCELASRMLCRVGFQGQLESNENGIIRQWESTDDIDILNRVTPKVGF